MKNLIFIILFIAISNFSFAQHYDLIITTSGDSIACKIDSITDSKIFFEMRFNYKWVHTQMDLSDYSEHKLKVIDKRRTKFKQGGSSYLMKKSEYYYEKTSIYDLKSNSVFSEIFFVLPSINYERLIVVSEGFGFTVGCGLVVFDPFLPMFDIGIITGHGKHSFELGVKIIPIVNDYYSLIKMGYRYTGKKNLYFKGGAHFILDDFFPIPSATIGLMF